jgi:hypothetical protein
MQTQEIQTQEMQKMKKQVNQMFNISEKVIMEYIAKFLDESPNIIFKDNIPRYSEHLILIPFDEYKNDKYLKFALEVAKKNDTKSKRIEFINDIIHHENVKEAVGFLTYVIKCTLPAVVASSMINNKPMLNISMELDEDTWSFCPTFKNEKFIKRKFYEDSLDRIQEFKMDKDSFDNLSYEKKLELDEEFNKTIVLLNEIEITNDIIESDKKINESYIDQYCLVIKVKEITKDKLPKPKSNPNQQLPTISTVSYKDVPN